MKNKQTPLHGEHIALGAKMVPFAGWDMPLQYEGIIAEHKACRESAALFDICHMGEFMFKGNIAESGIETAFTIRLNDIPVGRCRYCFMLKEDGTVIDDIIVYRISEDELMVVNNAVNIEKDFQNIQSHLKSGELKDVSDKTAKLDLQGPKAKEAIETVLDESAKTDIAGLKYFAFVKTSFEGEELLISRTGYTGEFGYELYSGAETALKLWRGLLKDERVKPAGLGVRDILRIEVGLSLYGMEISESITPVEADLMTFVNEDKEFTGKAACIKRKGNPEKIKISFKSKGRKAPRHGHKLLLNGEEVGHVSSGGFSPAVGVGIGMGFVNRKPVEGDKLSIFDGRKEMEVEECSLPFYKEGTALKKKNK